jgi:hypothetical protein
LPTILSAVVDSNNLNVSAIQYFDVDDKSLEKLASFALVLKRIRPLGSHAAIRAH